MKILAIESSGPAASAALWQDSVLIKEKSGPFKVTHSETLMPLIAEVIEETSTALDSLDAIAVSGGPGSFTGLRIGSASAKGLGLALEKPLIHVPTLDAMAFNFRGNDAIVVPLMDARRSQVYTGIYRFEGDRLDVVLGGCAMSIEDLVTKLNGLFNAVTDRVVFLGDGVAPSRETIEKSLTLPYEFAEGENAIQRAASVAALGAELALKGQFTDADMEAPEYLRPSQAERVRAEKNGN